MGKCADEVLDGGISLHARVVVLESLTVLTPIPRVKVFFHCLMNSCRYHNRVFFLLPWDIEDGGKKILM